MPRLPVIYYTDDLAAVREDMLQGFFAGWPRRRLIAHPMGVVPGDPLVEL